MSRTYNFNISKYVDLFLLLALNIKLVMPSIVWTCEVYLTPSKDGGILSRLVVMGRGCFFTEQTHIL